jgi:hypothetical protein
MESNVNGFKLEVTLVDRLPSVRLSLRDGTVVMETDRVSIVGLEKLPAVFEAAARMAFRLLEQCPMK